jgi:hypothetical protein
MLRHGVYHGQFRLYTSETTVIYLYSGLNKTLWFCEMRAK